MIQSQSRSHSSATLRLESMAIELPAVAGHPNRAPFRGVLTFVDVPSNKAPAGAQGHRVMLTRAATKRALPSLLGMALDYAPTLDRHDARRKVGVITSAVMAQADGRLAASTARTGAGSLAATSQSSKPAHSPVRKIRAGGDGLSAPPPSATGSRLAVSNTVPRIDVAGFIYARDFPELIREMKAGGRSRLGMSYEIAEARIDDLRASIWTITDFMFTGAAILRSDKAAYENTWIELE
ncbi:MAG TPA: hypothetical protein VG892_02880 [Terriglobales bacterium]|nr:hypothetical protein [Terriglobales bacterium]